MQKTPKGKSKCKNCSFLVYEAAVVLGEMSSDFRMKFQSVKCLASTGNTQNFILFNLTFAASFEVPSDVAQQKRRVVSSKIRLYSSTHFSISIYLIWLLFHLNFSQFEYREFGISGSSIPRRLYLYDEFLLSLITWAAIYVSINNFIVLRAIFLISYYLLDVPLWHHINAT